MKLEDIVKSKGLDITREEQKPKASSSPSNLGRRYFWDEETPENKPTNNLLKTTEKPTVETYEKDTNNILKTYEENKPTKEKPTHTPTNNLRANIRITTEKPTNLSELVGVQRLTFLTLVKMAKELGFLDSFGNRITPQINGNEFAKTFVNRSYKQTKDTLYHLKARGFIKVFSMKNGRGGNVQYLIEKELYQSCLIDLSFEKPTNNLLKTTEKPTQEPTSKPTNEAPYSSNNLIYNNNNNKETYEGDFQIPESISALGISQKSLQAIVRDNFLSKDEVQQSLEHYSHDLSKNLVKLKSAQFIMGILRNKTPYISTHFAQDEAKAVQAEIARIKQIQSERVELAELQLREQFEDYKLKNPNFLEEIKSGNQFLRSSSPKILDEIAFGKFKELINAQSQNQTP